MKCGGAKGAKRRRTKNKKQKRSRNHQTNQYFGILGGEMSKIQKVPKYCFFFWWYFSNFTCKSPQRIVFSVFLVFSTFHLQGFENAFFSDFVKAQYKKHAQKHSTRKAHSHESPFCIYIYMSAAQKHRACNRPGRPFCDKACNRLGGSCAKPSLRQAY